MDVKGVMAAISFDGDWVTITKKELGQQDRHHRISVRDITGTTFKPGSWLFHGYIQLLVAGSLPACETRGFFGGRPPRSDRNSLSISHKRNDEAKKIVAAIEEARVRLSP
ncbi:DUF4429 domain-containing protein [Streptomyces rishiriensis]|uniref:DUF4429 domain-containing protein n=1 Tax=Streptomyces rishiriensis TaxID=68264 RepID=UPI000D59CBFE|nr:DUF4429 domain-containing protein [Streptomyces rishiriensis]